MTPPTGQQSALAAFSETWDEAFRSQFPDTFAHDPEREAERDQWLAHPVDWIEQRLGEYVWSKQRDIVHSVRDHRYTAVKSCHGIGKSHIAARLVAWWVESHPPGQAFVVTTAPTGAQVAAVLWRYIRQVHARGNLQGRTNQTQWYLPLLGSEHLVAMGRKPPDHGADAFQGIHARFVLVIFDEADGVPPSLWNSGTSLVSNEESRFLAIGNPVNPASEFSEVCKPGSGYNVIKISAFDSPNFTDELCPEAVAAELISETYVNEMERKWGDEHPQYVSRVLAEFPSISEGGLIPYAWVKAAMDRSLRPGGPVQLSMDVGAGGDSSVRMLREGNVIRLHSQDRDPDTMASTGKLIAAIKETNAEVAKVDEIGIGKGVADRSAEIAADQEEDSITRSAAAKVRGVNIGRGTIGRPTPKQTQKEADEVARASFANLRAQAYWELRERFQEGTIDIDPEDEDLAAQLCDLRYKRTSASKIQIESKDDMRRRGRPSPDKADAVMLAFLEYEAEEMTGLTWGTPGWRVR
jgi:hypothetical protein